MPEQKGKDAKAGAKTNNPQQRKDQGSTQGGATAKKNEPKKR